MWCGILWSTFVRVCFVYGIPFNVSHTVIIDHIVSHLICRSLLFSNNWTKMQPTTILMSVTLHHWGGRRKDHCQINLLCCVNRQIRPGIIVIGNYHVCVQLSLLRNLSLIFYVWVWWGGCQFHWFFMSGRQFVSSLSHTPLTTEMLEQRGCSYYHHCLQELLV